MSNKAIDAWHDFVRTKNSSAFREALAVDVSFHSPVVHTPQEGRDITLMYLEAAHDVLSTGGFSYARELVGEHDAILEFNADINGVLVNGVDMIAWNDDQKITEFKVMIRPLKAVNMIHQEMAARLQAMSGRSAK
jgi:hypothetical protein